MNLRHARLEDAEQIALLHVDSWRRTYRGMMRDEFLDGDVKEDRLVVWRERLGSPAPNQLVVVAEEDSEIRGFVCAYGDDDPEWGSFVDNLHVRLDYQKQGIGAQLLGEAAAWAAANYSGRGLYLWVMQANDNAQRFYEHLGGANVGADVRGSAERGPAHVFRYAWPDPGAMTVR